MTSGNAKYLITSFVTLAFLSVLITGVQAQEVEPNDSCATAQEMGVVGLPQTVLANLDPAAGSGDVDFYRFDLNGVSATDIIVNLEGADSGKGTLQDPYLGAYSSDCILIASNDDAHSTLDSQLLLPIPADGIVTLAASSCCDDFFSGNHSETGTYELTIAETVLGDISGRFVNALTGTPFPQGGFVELYSCDEFGSCSSYVEDIEFDSDGTFVLPLAEGRYTLDYLILYNSPQVYPLQSPAFDLAAGQSLNLGDIPIAPYTINISNLQPCSSIPTTGGNCQFSFDVTNISSTQKTVAAWTSINAWDTGFTDFQTFQIGRITGTPPLDSIPTIVTLAPGATSTLNFDFNIPDALQNGAYFEIEAFISAPNSPLLILGQNSLFQINKGASQFSIATERSSREQRQLRSLKKKKTRQP